MQGITFDANKDSAAIEQLTVTTTATTTTTTTTTTLYYYNLHALYRVGQKTARCTPFSLQ